METITTLKLELQLPGQRIMHHLQTHNEQVEKEIEEGVNKAIEALSTAGTLEESVKTHIVNHIEKEVQRCIMNWKLTDIVDKVLTKKIESVVEQYSDEITAGVRDQLYYAITNKK